MARVFIPSGLDLNSVWIHSLIYYIQLRTMYNDDGGGEERRCSMSYEV